MAGSTLSFPVIGSSWSSNDTIGLGIIGTGSRGQGLMKTINKHFPQFKMVAACDIIPYRRAEAKAIAGNKCKVYTDHRALLEDKNVEAVIIASPLFTHHAIAMDAVLADKHVYCEKTMTIHIQETFELIEQVKKSDKVFQVGHQYRSTPLYFQIADLIKNGQIGEVTSIYVQWNRNGDWRRTVKDPRFKKMENWRMYRNWSSGLTAELHSHQIDYINSIFDSYPTRVTGFGGIDYWKDGRETFDNVNTLFEYPNGFKVNCVSLTANAHEGYYMKFRGSKGTIAMDMNDAWIYNEVSPKEKEKWKEVDGVSGATEVKWRRGEAVKIEPEVQREGWFNTRYALDEFHNCIMNGKVPYSNVYNGGGTAICVRMAVDAMRKGTIEPWLPEYDKVLPAV